MLTEVLEYIANNKFKNLLVQTKEEDDIPEVIDKLEERHSCLRLNNIDDFYKIIKLANRDDSSSIIFICSSKYSKRNKLHISSYMDHYIEIHHSGHSKDNRCIRLK